MDDKNLKKILFVDDEESILDVASEYFKRKGYEVQIAKNGLEAVKILESEKIDCCFTDINMPRMDGLALAEHIRGYDNTLPVIIMTGYPSLDNTIRTLKNGVVDFLIKPVNLKQMELCVRRVFSQRRLFVENLLLKKEVESKERLENLNRELTVKVKELNVLNKILSDFSRTRSTKSVFKRLVDMTIEITDSDISSFYIINEAVKEPFGVAHAVAEKNDAGDSRASAVEVSHFNQPPSADEDQSIECMIMEIAADGLPLLVSENNGSQKLPPDALSMMIVPLKIREKVFGVLMASVQHGGARFTEKDLYYLHFMAQNAANAIENLALYENIYENLFATLYAFVNAIEARDRYTQQHSNRVTLFSTVIGQEMGCTSEELDTLNFAGHLHDIGKIGIRDDILLKPGKLTKKEFEKIKEHPVIGANIVEQLGFWEKERQIIRWHHERYDGTGYPDGLKNDEIPILSRILSVADVYDAISSDRTYRKKMDESQALKIIREGAGTQFDPNIVDIFLKLYQEGKFNSQQIHETPNNFFDRLQN